MRRIAVIAFNLGGPDRPSAVEPFLRNLFSDPFILRVPWLLRICLAWFIARRRSRVAAGIYDRIGGGSPILEETRKQAEALERELSGADAAYRVFVAMRHWHPMAEEVAFDVADWRPDETVLLPLYPQFSTSTTQSFLEAWKRAARAARLAVPESAICCWPELAGFAEAMARRTADALARLPEGARPRILFSAHGLPRRFVEEGDPYAELVGRSVAAIVARLPAPAPDHVICYQSRVGRLEWLRPYAEDEIRRAGGEGLSLVVVPVSFVCEHSETLVELDIEYAELAASCGVPHYLRVPAVGEDPVFIAGLAGMVRRAAAPGLAAEGAVCGPDFGCCPAGTAGG